ncbi:MAG: hypothetical protein ABL907_13905 [Hyphomicrobium sp.]
MNFGTGRAFTRRLTAARTGVPGFVSGFVPEFVSGFVPEFVSGFVPG